MAETLTDELATYGIDYVDAMDRFADNAALFKKMALKYLDDGHYVALVAAMEAKDYDTAYKEAHGLKGVTGNLSLASLYKVSAIISDALHNGEIDAATQHMPELANVQKETLAGLEAWRDGAFGD